MKKHPFAGRTVRVGDMSGLLGLSSQRIQQLISQGVMVRAPDGNGLLLKESVENYLAGLRRNADLRKPKAVDPEEDPKLELLAEKLNLVRAKNEIRRASLFPSDGVRKVMTAMLVAADSRWDTLLARVEIIATKRWGLSKRETKLLLDNIDAPRRELHRDFERTLKIITKGDAALAEDDAAELTR